MNIVNVTALAVGGILLYSAIRDDNPVEVVKSALKGKTATPVATPTQQAPMPSVSTPPASYVQPIIPATTPTIVSV